MVEVGLWQSEERNNQGKELVFMLTMADASGWTSAVLEDCGVILVGGLRIERMRMSTHPLGLQP